MLNADSVGAVASVELLERLFSSHLSVVLSSTSAMGTDLGHHPIPPSLPKDKDNGAMDAYPTGEEKTINPHSPDSSASDEPADIDLPDGGVKEPDGDVVTFPDGGLRAWLVVAGSSHILFCSFGFVNAWGVFQDYYQQELFTDRTASQM